MDPNILEEIRNRLSLYWELVSRNCLRMAKLLAATPNAKVSDWSQPPMTFALSLELNGWLPFAAPSGSMRGFGLAILPI